MASGTASGLQNGDLRFGGTFSLHQNLMFTRWFSTSSVCAEGLFNRLREGVPELDVEFKKTGRSILMVTGGLLLFLFVLVGAGLVTNEQKPDAQSMKKLGAIATTLILTGGALTWWVVGRYNRRLIKRVLAFDDAAEKYQFAHCGNVKLEDAYGLPLVYEEQLPGCPGKISRAWLCGRWNEVEFAWLQGSHLNDPVFRGKDTGLISVILRLLFGRNANKANRVRRMHFETIVFSEELQLPDVVLGHSHIGVTTYLKRELKQKSQPLQGIPKTRLLTWGATSDSRGTVGLFDQIADLFNSRPCLIQVISGRVVVFLNYSHGEMSKRVTSLKHVESELDFAHQIFYRLKLVAQAQSPVDEPATSYEEVANEQRLVAFKKRAARNKKRARRHVSWRKVAAGFVLMGFAFMMCGGSLMLIRDNPNDAVIQKEQRTVLLYSVGFGVSGLLMTAWGGGFLRRREPGMRGGEPVSMVTASAAQATGLSSAKYFQDRSC